MIQHPLALPLHGSAATVEHIVGLDFKLCEGSPYLNFSEHFQKLCFTLQF